MATFTAYHLALRTALAFKGTLRVVVIGANDGKTNDPMYPFARKHAAATHVLLVEPNQPLLPFLRGHYAFHPSHQVANCAIGEEGVLTLHAVKPAYWERFQPGYARDWPPYRAATGLTSAHRAHLEKALRGEGLDPDEAIEVLSVPAMHLADLLRSEGWPASVDVLQVDAEGYDDVVLRNSNLEQTAPTLICFESHSLSREKLEALRRHLADLGYRLYPAGGNSLAVPVRPSPLNLALHGLLLLGRGLQRLGQLLDLPFAALRRLRKRLKAAKA
jgi:FkbM family methyltransferase